MKFLLKDVWASQRSLQKLAKATPLPIKTTYWVGIRMKKIIKEIEALEASRLELVKKYGEPESGTDQISVPPDRIEAFTKEFNERLEGDVEIDIQKFTLEDFKMTTSLTGEDMMNLAFLFEEQV